MKLEVVESKPETETMLGWALVTADEYCVRGTIIINKENEITLLLDDIASIKMLDVVTVDYKLSGQESQCDLIGVVTHANSMRATINFS